MKTVIPKPIRLPWSNRGQIRRLASSKLLSRILLIRRNTDSQSAGLFEKLDHCYSIFVVGD